MLRDGKDNIASALALGMDTGDKKLEKSILQSFEALLKLDVILQYGGTEDSIAYLLERNNCLDKIEKA